MTQERRAGLPAQQDRSNFPLRRSIFAPRRSPFRARKRAPLTLVNQIETMHPAKLAGVGRRTSGGEQVGKRLRGWW